MKKLFTSTSAIHQEISLHLFQPLESFCEFNSQFFDKLVIQNPCRMCWKFPSSFYFFMYDNFCISMSKDERDGIETEKSSFYRKFTLQQLVMAHMMCERERWQKVLKYLYTNAYTKKGDKKWMKCHPYLWLAPHLRPSLLSCLNSRTVHRNLYAESVIICLYCCIWCDMIRLVSTFLTHNSIVWIYREKKLWSSTKIP